MHVIGVTGGVGTGKSTVAAMFQGLGATVLDADVIAHRVMEPRRLAWRQVVKTFGEEILNEDQTVNRRRLASIVFGDDARRRQLEAIVHPHVIRLITRQVHRMRRARRAGAVVLDVPLLFEAGAEGLADTVVVVNARPEIQRQRLQQAGWSGADIAARRAAQWDLSAKAALADYVVENSDGLDATRIQVKRIWKQLGLDSSKSGSTSQRSKS